RDAGIGPGDPVVIWGENRGEWLSALWGVLLVRAVAVPVDFRSSPDHAHRIRDIINARVMVAGADVDPRDGEGYAIWRMDDATLFDAPVPTAPTAPTVPTATASE